MPAATGGTRRVAVALTAVLAALAATLPAASAGAETDAQLRARSRSAQVQLAEAQEGLAGTGRAAQQAAADLADVQGRQPAARAALDAAAAAVRTAHDRDVELAGRYAAAQRAEQVATADLAASAGDVASTSRTLARIASAAYRSGGLDPGLSVALDAASPGDFTDRYVLVDAALRAQSGTMAHLQQQRALAGHSAERLVAVRAQAADLRRRAADHLVATRAAEDDAAARAADLAALADQRARSLAELQAQQAQYEREVADAQAASDDITAQLKARADAAAAARAAAGGRAPAPSASGGALGAPLAHLTVTSPFGWRVHPVYHTRRLHAGTDFRAACGTPVYATADGEVVRAGPGTGYGNILVVDSGSVAGRPVATAYAHLSRFDVAVGQAVRRGQLIAHSGSTGVGTACHLHFEVRVAGVPVDPAAWL